MVKKQELKWYLFFLVTTHSPGFPPTSLTSSFNLTQCRWVPGFHPSSSLARFSSLVILISHIALYTLHRLTTSKCIAPVLKLPLKFRLWYDTIFSTFQLGCLIRMSNQTCSKPNLPSFTKPAVPSVQHRAGNILDFSLFVTSCTQFRSKSCIFNSQIHPKSSTPTALLQP